MSPVGASTGGASVGASAGAVSSAPSNCFATSAWAPAELRVHSFPLDHGGQELDCPACHLDEGYVEYTCIECHEHDPRQIRGEHVEKGISDLSECAGCHPTGHAEEATQAKTAPVALQSGRGGSHE